MNKQSPLMPIAFILLIFAGVSLVILGNVEDVLRDILSIMEQTP